MRMMARCMVTVGVLLLFLGQLPQARAAPPEAVEADFALAGSSLSRSDLQALRGGEAISSSLVNQINQNAGLNDNVVDSSITGDNIVNHEVLSGARGIPTIIQNTGNNVIIQNTTIVNFVDEPQPAN